MIRKTRKWLLILGLCLGAFLIVRRYWHPTPDPLQAQFIMAKHAEARSLAPTETNPIPARVWAFFRAAERNDIKSAADIYGKLAESEYSPRTNRPPWEKLWDGIRDAVGIAKRKGFHETYYQPIWTPIHEADSAIHLFHGSNPKWIRRLGSEIAGYIGTNSVLFTATDTSRIAVLCVSESVARQRSFFTISLAALADGGYMDYLRQSTGNELSIPTMQDSQAAFDGYMCEAQRRMKEFYSTNAPSEPYPGGTKPGVLEINSRLAKRFIEKNPGRIFFSDDAFSAEWMLPFLEPCGPILRLHATPVETLSADVVQRDRAYWNRLFNEWLGGWFGEGTPTEEVCRFCETVYQRKDLSKFKGDASFVADERVRSGFARLRASIGRVYQWQAEHAGSPPEQQRLRVEADYAFRQALGLCPSLPEASETYAKFLSATNRKEDALAVARLWAASSPDESRARDTLRTMESLQAEGRSESIP